MTMTTRTELEIKRINALKAVQRWLFQEIEGHPNMHLTYRKTLLNKVDDALESTVVDDPEEVGNAVE